MNSAKLLLKPPASRGLNAFQLKTLACFFMLLDHIGVLLVTEDPWYTLLRVLGRLAFPIFAYMLANGFRHTGSRSKYLLRLAVFALAVQVVYEMSLGSDMLNIFVTLSLGLLAIWGYEELTRLPVTAEAAWQKWLFRLAGCLWVLALAYLGKRLNVDYWGYGVLLIFTAHLCYDRPALLALVWLALTATVCFFTPMSDLQLWAVAAVALLACYNHRPGPRGFWPKWGFYLFYCLHLPLLYGLSLLLG